MDITALLDGGIFGAVTGLLGTGITAYVNFKNRKLDMEEAKRVRDHGLIEIKAETDNSIRLARVVQEGQEEDNDAKSFNRTLNKMKDLFKKEYADKVPAWLMGYVIAPAFAFIDILRASVRPVGTYYFMFLFSAMAVRTYMDIPEAFDASAIANKIAFTIIYLAVMSYTWWFGDRRLAKNMAKGMK